MPACRVEVASGYHYGKEHSAGTILFWWRKRNEGFEWREYVRTTILVRREERRQRVKDVQEAAAAQVKEAGRRGVEAAVVGGRAAAAGSWWSLQAAGSGLKRAAAWTAHAVARGAVSAVKIAVKVAAAVAAGIAAGASGTAGLVRRASHPLVPVIGPLLIFARRPKPRLMLTATSLLTGLGAVYRSWAFGFDADAKVAAAVSIITGILAAMAILADPDREGHQREESLIASLRSYRINLPGDRHLSADAGALVFLALIGVAAVSLLASGGYMRGSAHVSDAGRAATASSTTAKHGAPAANAAPRADVSARTTLTSRRAQAITGDTLKMGSTYIALDGVEAPETGQLCQRASGRWRCGRAARAALARLVRGRSVTCEVSGERNGGIKTGVCTAGGADLAETLLEAGMVFATSGFFLNAHARIERKARAENKGLWAGGAERPQEWRDRRWAEASEKAPEGCPIKGRVRAGSRIYILPWSTSYESVRLSRARGERWFCSENEAEAAGWRRASPS